MKIIGFAPNISNLVDMLNYQMPKYAWFSAKQNKKSTTSSVIKMQLFPTSLDGKIYVSDDLRFAAIWHSKNILSIFQEENGLRESLYQQPQQKIRDPQKISE